MKKFKINWTNNSIKYNSKEKNIVLCSMEKVFPFKQGLYLKKFDSKFKIYLGNSGNACSVANRSNALDLKAMLVGTKKVDEFIIQAHIWFAKTISYARLLYNNFKRYWQYFEDNFLIGFNRNLQNLNSKLKDNG